MADFSKKSLVFVFGRFQPPTAGHQKLVNAGAQLATHTGADFRVFISPAQQNDVRDPLTYNQRQYFLSLMIPGLPIGPRLAVLPDVCAWAATQGYKTLTMVVGGDRLNEMQRFCRNMTSRPDWASDMTLQAVSSPALARTALPISGSQMRAFVTHNNFESFQKGLPTRNTQIAKLVWQALIQVLPMQEELTLTEGVFDKAIFKAIFLGGAPGAGKSTVSRRALSGLGLKELNSDVAFEYLMDKAGLSKILAPETEDRWGALRQHAKFMKAEQEKNWVAGRLGLVIDMTSDDATKVQNIKTRLEGLGYDTMMVFVNVTNEVSRIRNIRRGDAGGRTVPEQIRNEKWHATQRVIGALQHLFGTQNFVIVDSSDKLDQQQLMATYRQARRFTTTPVRKPQALQWIHQQRGFLSDTVGRSVRTENRIFETWRNDLRESDHFAEGVLDTVVAPTGALGTVVAPVAQVKTEAKGPPKPKTYKPPTEVDKVKGTQQHDKERFSTQQATQLQAAKIKDMQAKFAKDREQKARAETAKRLGLSAPKNESRHTKAFETFMAEESTHQSGLPIGTEIPLLWRRSRMTAVLYRIGAFEHHGEEWRILNDKGQYLYTEGWRFVKAHRIQG